MSGLDPAVNDGYVFALALVDTPDPRSLQHFQASVTDGAWRRHSGAPTRGSDRADRDGRPECDPYEYRGAATVCGLAVLGHAPGSAVTACCPDCLNGATDALEDGRAVLRARWRADGPPVPRSLALAASTATWEQHERARSEPRSTVRPPWTPS